MTFSRLVDPVRYLFTCSASMEIRDGREWSVSHNPAHGEVEFCNLWPDGSFNPSGPKRYTSCCLVSGGQARRIPHQHLESSDKHNLQMGRGDRFLWVLENENLCLEIRSPDPVSAGICAYMWDAHFAYSVCTGGRDRVLPGGTRYEAEYVVSSLSVAEAQVLTRNAFEVPDPGSADVPVILSGQHTFRETFGSLKGDTSQVWPWEREVTGGDARGVAFDLDRSRGYDDSYSLRISSGSPVSAAWKAAAYGPPFGGPAFEDRRRYRLTAMVLTEKSAGHTSIALRLHIPGRGDVFQPESYDLFPSSEAAPEGKTWARLEVMTPLMPQAPDRLHVLLRHVGTGTAWFDNVLLETLE